MSEELPIAGPEGNVWVPVDSLTADDRSLAAEHRAAITAYQADGDASRLHPFEGVSIAGIQLVTDPDTIDDNPDDYYIETFYTPGKGPGD